MNQYLLLVSTLLFVTLQVNGEVFQDKFFKAGQDCQTEKNYPAEVAAILKVKNLPANENERCYLECVYNKLGLIKNNVLDEVAAKALAQERFATDPVNLQKAYDLYAKCKPEIVIDAAKSDKCQLGHLLRSCFIKNAGELPFASPTHQG